MWRVLRGRSRAISNRVATTLRVNLTHHCTSHPRVDIGPLLRKETNESSRKAVISELAHAMKSKGYFYADGVDPLPSAYIQSIYHILSSLHQLPLEVCLVNTFGAWTKDFCL
jgi:hypothetical protein